MASVTISVYIITDFHAYVGVDAHTKTQYINICLCNGFRGL